MTIQFAPPTLATERLILRGPKAADAPAFAAFYASARSRYAGGPMTAAQSWRALAADFGHWAMLGFGRFMLTLRGRDDAVGLAGPYFPAGRPEKEIGWVLFDETLEGQGLAREAAQATIDHAWHTLGWATMVSYINPANTRSIALAERLGATLDPDAPQPKPDDPCLIYRHPKPEAAHV